MIIFNQEALVINLTWFSNSGPRLACEIECCLYCLHGHAIDAKIVLDNYSKSIKSHWHGNHKNERAPLAVTLDLYDKMMTSIYIYI
jgi:hypothetical protein